MEHIVTTTNRELRQTLKSAQDDLEVICACKRLLIQLFSDDDEMTPLDRHITSVLCLLDETRNRMVKRVSQLDDAWQTANQKDIIDHEI